jgi:putative endonuclease
MPYSVYILLNKSKTRTYTGVADDVKKRLKRHNDGNVPASRPYRPYGVIHIETYATLKEARQKEQFYKSTTGRRRLREIIDRVSIDVNY